jgi:hypothetical protein
MYWLTYVVMLSQELKQLNFPHEVNYLAIFDKTAFILLKRHYFNDSKRIGGDHPLGTLC